LASTRPKNSKCRKWSSPTASADKGLGYSRCSGVARNSAYCGSNARRASVSMNSLKTPPPSMPASSVPKSLTKVTCTRPRSPRPKWFIPANASS
jgi:hypothetical protein